MHHLNSGTESETARSKSPWFVMRALLRHKQINEKSALVIYWARSSARVSARYHTSAFQQNYIERLQYDQVQSPVEKTAFQSLYWHVPAAKWPNYWPETVTSVFDSCTSVISYQFIFCFLLTPSATDASSFLARVMRDSYLNYGGGGPLFRTIDWWETSSLTPSTRWMKPKMNEDTMLPRKRATVKLSSSRHSDSIYIEFAVTRNRQMTRRRRGLTENPNAATTSHLTAFDIRFSSFISDENCRKLFSMTFLNYF